MGVAHVGLVHHDPCECKVKGFHAVSSIESNVSKRDTCKGCDSRIVLYDVVQIFAELWVDEVSWLENLNVILVLI